jgi:hypothetical protein
MRGGDNDPSSLSDECLGCCEAKTAAASSNEVHPVTQSEIHPGILAQQHGRRPQFRLGQACGRY